MLPPVSEYKFSAQGFGDFRHRPVVSRRTKGFSPFAFRYSPFVPQSAKANCYLLLNIIYVLWYIYTMTLGDLLEGIVLHAFEGKAPFSESTLKEIEKLRSIYGLTLKATDSHQLKEKRK